MIVHINYDAPDGMFSHLGFATKCKKYCIAIIAFRISSEHYLLGYDATVQPLWYIIGKRIRIDTAQNFQFYMLAGIHALNIQKGRSTPTSVQRPVMRQV